MSASVSCSSHTGGCVPRVRRTTQFTFETVRGRSRCVPQMSQSTVTLPTTIVNCPSGYSRVSVKSSVSGCPAAVSMSCAMLTHKLSRSSSCPRCLGCLIPHFTLSCSARVLKLAGVLSVLGSLSILKILVPRALSKNCVVKLV